MRFNAKMHERRHFAVPRLQRFSPALEMDVIEVRIISFKKIFKKLFFLNFLYYLFQKLLRLICAYVHTIRLKHVGISLISNNSSLQERQAEENRLSQISENKLRQWGLTPLKLDDRYVNLTSFTT